MGIADIHIHTNHSHGKNSVQEMYAGARELGVEVLGFSEHSPRPEAYSYPAEYRDHLAATWPEYISSVLALKEKGGLPKVLLGLEMDYFPREEDYLRKMIAAYPYDYIIGSVHYLGTWGFDFSADDWKSMRDEDAGQLYHEYFRTLTAMANTGFAQVAAHPDIIKIFSIGRFNSWLQGGEARESVRGALQAMKNSNMVMEISSAGLRKPCREIYPGPALMEMAAQIGLPVSLSSDAHNVADIIYGYETLAAYAREYGYTAAAYVEKGQVRTLPL